MSFNKDFVWGAATAAYQIEGAYRQDGKGLSIWDVAAHSEGFVKNGDTGDGACDHYNRYKEDVKIMKEIGIKGYRFSIAWTRVLPEGIGRINQKGLDFYDKLIDQLLENDIHPYATLFHWDYPMELYIRGGWLNPDSPKWFAEYAKIIVDRLSDRVTYWFTLNEPQCFIGMGHSEGKHAPGIRLPLSQVLTAGHNALLAHGMAVDVIRKNAKQPSKIGYAPCGLIKIPATNNEKDIAAARKATFSVVEKDHWNNTWWMDPVFLGEYPQDGLKLFEEDLPHFGEDDFKIISQPIDFCGVNIYHSEKVKEDNNGGFAIERVMEGRARTALHWSVTPESLYWGPKFLYERYQKPIFITENGLSNCDWVALDGKIHDPQRIDFLHRYLRAYKQAAEEGIPLEGYFCWSLMDNFEWAEGYDERFGLVHVDFQTLKRTKKDSAYWYKEVIATNGINL